VPKPVSRYSVAIPEEEALFTGFGTRVAVSPDGSRLVYVGAGEQTSRLLLRDLDQLHATPLPGTNNPDMPFFSPDGSRVGFRARGAWRVTSLGGGPPITIADPDFRIGSYGGSWGSDGYLYFDANDNGLVRVPEGGGPPETVTMIDSAQGEEAHVWPEALPGGRGVVFSVRRGGFVNLTEWDIAVSDLAMGMHSVLVRGVRARYAASGHLLYVTADGTLMAVPFDETTLALTGDAVPLVEGLRVGIDGTMDLAVSATGTLFYTTGGVSGGGLAELVWVTRDGTAEEIDPDWTGNLHFPKLSPEGTRLAVGITANDESQIWIKELDRGPLPKLTFRGTLNQRPAWTPDGRSVAFGSNRGGDLDLYVRRADGAGQAELLLDDEQHLGEVTFSPDGEWLVYRVSAGGRDLYALRMGVDSLPLPLVTTESSETSPAVSPDGRWLAYASDESGQYEVYVRPFPNTNDGKWQVSTDGGQEPVWAHSGRELFYKGSGDLIVVEVLPGAAFVPGERRALFSHQGYYSTTLHQFYDVTPDDQRFVMIRNRGADDAGELIVVENFFEELKTKVGR
jgi:serine/threonine-protein kinase